MLALTSFWAGLAMAAWFDAMHRRIPNLLNASIAGIGLLMASSGRGPIDLATAGASMALCFGLMFLPFAVRIFRGGDLKLVVAGAAWLGPYDAALATVAGVILGGLIALGMVLSDRRERRALNANLWAAVFIDRLRAPEDIDHERPTVPMGIAFAITLAIASLGGFEWL